MPDSSDRTREVLHRRRSRGLWLRRNWELYLLLLPTLLYFVIFHYGPMYGVQIAFKDYSVRRGITGSPWIGLEHFVRFFQSYHFGSLLANTLRLSVATIVFGFPAPIVLAIVMNLIAHGAMKKVVQTTVYAPHFISTVVLAGMLFVFLAPRMGVVNLALRALGAEEVFFMADPRWFRPLYVLSGIWQNAGWSSMIYLAALSAVSPELYEAAAMDGAGLLRKIVHIEIPSLVPTMVVMLILRLGQVMSVDFQKTLLMQTPLNLATSEVIATYVYKVGLLMGQFGFSTAVGLFNNVVNLLLLVAANRAARATAGVDIW